MRFTFTECPTVFRSAVTLEKRIFLLVVTSSAVLTDHIVARVLKKHKVNSVSRATLRSLARVYKHRHNSRQKINKENLRLIC